MALNHCARWCPVQLSESSVLARVQGSLRAGLVIVGVMACIIGTAPASAQAGGEMKVALKPAKPFTFEDGGQWKGYSIDLWNEITQLKSWRSVYLAKEKVPEVLGAIKNKEADIAIGALSVTEEREKQMDFSHPIYESGLQIVTKSSSVGSLLDAAKGLLSAQVLGGLAFLVLALLAVSWVLWRLERHDNEDSFPKSASRGMKESLWWSTNVLIAGGCENIAPIGTAGRLVAVVWMLGGIAFTSYITAVFTSTLTVNRLDSAVHELKDLEGENIATVGGSSSADYLKKNGSKTVEFPNIDEAMNALSRKDIKAVVYDSPIVRYWLTTHTKQAEEYVLAGEPFARQHYAFALPMGSDLRKEVNEALLQLKTSGRMEEINKRWFGGAGPGAN